MLHCCSVLRATPLCPYHTPMLRQTPLRLDDLFGLTEAPVLLRRGLRALARRAFRGPVIDGDGVYLTPLHSEVAPNTCAHSKMIRCHLLPTPKAKKHNCVQMLKAYASTVAHKYRRNHTFMCQTHTCVHTGAFAQVCALTPTFQLLMFA